MVAAATIAGVLGKAAPVCLSILQRIDDAPRELKQSRSKIHQAHQILVYAENSGLSDTIYQPLIDALEKLSVVYESAQQGQAFHAANTDAVLLGKGPPFLFEFCAWKWGYGGFTTEMDDAQEKVNKEMAFIAEKIKVPMQFEQPAKEADSDSYIPPQPDGGKAETGSGSPSAHFSAMEYVVVRGLERKIELNDRVGMVVQYEGGIDKRYRVVTDLGAEQFKIREVNLNSVKSLQLAIPVGTIGKPPEDAPASATEPEAAHSEGPPSPNTKFELGSLVQLHDIRACPEYNGHIGKIAGYSGGPERRYLVLVAGKVIYPREECLFCFRPESRFTEPGVKPRGPLYPATFDELLHSNPSLRDAVMRSGGYHGMNEGWKNGDARGVVAHLRGDGWPSFKLPENVASPSTSARSLWSASSPSSAASPFSPQPASCSRSPAGQADGPRYAPLSHVVIHGSSAHELNGQVGQVLSYVGGESKRYIVLVANIQVNVKEVRLSLFS